ncbi:hypothetical protein ACFQ1S_01185, partial [Kibdelosporangium lantanae]
PLGPPPQPILLAERVLAAEQTSGQHRLIYDLQQKRMLKWIDAPVPRIAWRSHEQHEPAIHRRDLATYRRMFEALPKGPVTAQLRFRTIDGDWLLLNVTAALMALDQETLAALVTMTQPDPAARLIE